MRQAIARVNEHVAESIHKESGSQVYGFSRNFTESGLALRMYEIHKKLRKIT